MTGSSAMSSPSSLEEASFPAQSKRPTPKHKLQGHERDIWSFVFLHDNIHIVSGSWDGTMRKWDCDTGLLVGEPWVGVGGDIYAMALSPDGNMIACGREDGSVQRWDTDGKIMEGVWKGHSGRVESLSWSPSGGRIASGADDETILIRNAESGEVEVGPIETKQGWVYSLAYSPSGDKIASGGYNTICIWDSNTGELLVGPIKDFDFRVTSVIWSSDSSKLYTASGKFARVFDTAAGTLIHHFEHDKYVFSIAFTPKHNVLACAGIGGLAQLWDTESYQPLGKPFGEEDCEDLFCVTFSRDGRYLAYGGSDEKITLWMVEDIAPELPSLSSSFLDVIATNQFMQSGEGGAAEEGHDDPYDNFFQSSSTSRPLSSSGLPRSRPHISFARFQKIFRPLRHRPPANEVVEVSAARGFRRYVAWKRPRTHKRKSPATSSASPPAAPPASVPPLPRFWKCLNHLRRRPPAHDVIEVSTARRFQRYVPWKRIHKSKSPAVTGGAPLPAAQHAGGSSEAVPYSPSHHVHAATSSHAVSGQTGSSSQSMVGHVPAAESSLSHVTTTHDPSHDSDSDSDSSIQGFWKKFLIKLCFPHGCYLLPR